MVEITKFYEMDFFHSMNISLQKWSAFTSRNHVKRDYCNLSLSEGGDDSQRSFTFSQSNLLYLHYCSALSAAVAQLGQKSLHLLQSYVRLARDVGLSEETFQLESLPVHVEEEHHSGGGMSSHNGFPQ